MAVVGFNSVFGVGSKMAHGLVVCVKNKNYKKKKELPKMTKKDVDVITGRNIRTEREKRGLSREELASSVGVTISHMGLIERGERGVTATNLVKFSRVLGVSINSLFHPENEESSVKEDKLKEKLSALTSRFSESEMEFIIDMAQNIYKLQLRQ